MVELSEVRLRETVPSQMEEQVEQERITSVPEPVFTLFAFLARQGVHISDLFRRPGNINQMKVCLDYSKIFD